MSCASKQGQKVPMEPLLGGPRWCEFFTGCVSILIPEFEHCSRVQDFLDVTAANSTSLVRRVSTELWRFPMCDEALFLALAWKKWRFADAECCAERRTKALDGFVERNARARDLPLPDVITLDRMRFLLNRWLPFQGVAPGRFGPGAVAERLSHRRRWQSLSRVLSSGYDEDPLTEEDRSNFGSYSDCLYQPLSGTDWSVPARLCAVPKDWNKDRLISVEPCSRTFLQHSARESLMAAIHAGPLRNSAVDLFADGQRIQRELALQGSATGKFATLDLSDASDNITADLVYSVFPSWVCALLEQARTPLFEDRGRIHSMHIYAGMGNATTFLVESLLFTAYCEAIRWRHGIKADRASVFGDDIICHPDVALAVIDANDSFFRVNSDKSFYRSDDKLRESCGIFALDGKDITPARFNGFPQGFAGRMGLSEYIMEKATSPLAYQIRLADLMARESLRQGVLDNFPIRIEGYPSISIEWLPTGNLPPLRRHKDYQFLEAQVCVPTPLTEDVDVTCVRWALQASLAQRITTQRRAARSVTRFPIAGKWAKPRKRWRRAAWVFRPMLECEVSQTSQGSTHPNLSRIA